jgi:hypothetical protein
MIDAATRKEHRHQWQRESAARRNAKLCSRLTCKDCKYSYARQYFYDEHFLKCRTEGPKRPWSIDCGESYQAKCALQAHQREAHGGDYTGMAILEQKRHHNYEFDQCPGSSYSQFEGLRRHQREAHGVYNGDGVENHMVEKKQNIYDDTYSRIIVSDNYNPSTCTASPFVDRAELRKHQRVLPWRRLDRGSKARHVCPT